MRIVSLLPSATEILFALGAGDDLVGVTVECDYPPAARDRRIVSTSTLPAGLDAAGIDAVVAERKATGAQMYRLDEGALADLDADLVITQDLCAVCAAEVSQVRQALEHLGSDAEVLTVDPHTLADVLDSLVLIGEATGRVSQARRLVASLSARLDAIREKIGDRRRVRTLILEWTDPPFAPGHWIPDMVAAAGGESVMGRPGDASFRTDWDAVSRAEPDVIVSAPCGFDLPGSERLAADLTDRAVLPAGVPLWAVDADSLFVRPGPRLVDGVETLASILHPEVFGPPAPKAAGRR